MSGGSKEKKVFKETVSSNVHVLPEEPPTFLLGFIVFTNSNSLSPTVTGAHPASEAGKEILDNSTKTVF